jgi:hypothetical protein
MQDTPAPLKITRRTLLAALPALLLTAGCAKSPSSGITSPTSGPQLFVTLSVLGNINPNYYYFVLFNVNNTPNQNNSSVTGPVPVVAPPYGNGFAAGAITNFVEYNSGVPGGTDIGFYNFSDPNLLQPNYLGTGRYLVTAQAVGNTLSFQLPLIYLATAAITVDLIQSLQVNFLTTNTVPLIGQNLTQPKYFDSLGTADQTGTYGNIIVRSGGGPVQQVLFQENSSGVGTTGVLQNIGSSFVPVTAQDFPNVNDLTISNFSIRLNP